MDRFSFSVFWGCGITVFLVVFGFIVPSRGVLQQLISYVLWPGLKLSVLVGMEMHDLSFVVLSLVFNAAFFSVLVYIAIRFLLRDRSGLPIVPFDTKLQGDEKEKKGD